MKRRVIVALTLVLVVALLGTSVLAFTHAPGYQSTSETRVYYNEKGEVTRTESCEYTYGDNGEMSRSKTTTEDKEAGTTEVAITDYTYDQNGNLTKIVESVIADGKTKAEVVFTEVSQRDSQGRKVKTTLYNGTEKGEVSSVTNWEHSDYGITKESYYIGAEKAENLFETYEYEYDKQGNCIKQIYTCYKEGEESTYTTTYKFNNDGLLVEENDNGIVITLTYNDNWDLVKEVGMDGDQELFVNTFEVDSKGNVIKETYEDKVEGTKDQYDYTYDNNGNVLSVSCNGEALYKYSYQANGDLKRFEDIAGGRKEEYTYDDQGNLTNVVCTVTDPETGEERVENEQTNENKPVENYLPYSDVKAGKYYYSAVAWAHDNAVTTGKPGGIFDPNSTCTRAEVVTFLYRAAGYPAIATTECDFSDVELDSWYTDAVLWAVENGITTGKPGGIFDPTGVVTRAEFVTFLYRAAQAEKTQGENPFPDIEDGKWYYDSVLWAAENGVTTGKPDGTFDHAGQCSRGETVTFMYRYYG